MDGLFHLHGSSLRSSPLSYCDGVQSWLMCPIPDELMNQRTCEGPFLSKGKSFGFLFPPFFFPFALPPMAKPLNPTLTRPAPDSYSSRSTEPKALHQGSMLESFPLLPQRSPNPPSPHSTLGTAKGQVLRTLLGKTLN